MLPNFIICGIQKGGTTSLYHYLRLQPDVFMPDVKEINFFNINYEKGCTWYENHFAPWRGERALGEASPLYMWYPEVPGRIASLIPAPRLIFTLRNPIERAYSNYWFNISRGAQNPNQSFSEAIQNKDGHRRYITKGFYYEQIMRFLRYFNRNQLHIIITEDLKSNPEGEVRGCLQFMNVNSACLSDLQNLHNVTTVPKGPLSMKLSGLWITVKDFVRPWVPDAFGNMTRGIRKGIHGWFFVPEKPPPMTREDHNYLREVFYKHNTLLADFLERDLHEWQ